MRYLGPYQTPRSMVYVISGSLSNIQRYGVCDIWVLIKHSEVWGMRYLGPYQASRDMGYEMSQFLIKPPIKCCPCQSHGLLQRCVLVASVCLAKEHSRLDGLGTSVDSIVAG